MIADWQEKVQAPESHRRIARVPATEVSISGWDGLLADIVKAEQREGPCKAIGIDVTGHSEGPDPFFEVALYDDHAFAFSDAGREAIVASGLGYPTPWQGTFFDASVSLRWHGLNEAIAAIEAYPDRYVQPEAADLAEYLSFLLLNWFTYLRLVQGLERELAVNGLPRQMPVLVSQHDFGPNFFTVLMNDTIAQTEARARPVLDTREREARERFLAHVEGELESYRLARDTIRGFSRWFMSKQQKDYLEFRRASEMNEGRSLGFSTARPTWEMSDTEFTNFEAIYREAWKTGSVAGRQLFPSAGSERAEPQWEKPSPSTRPSFGRKGL